jgi:hypothetical protein
MPDNLPERVVVGANGAYWRAYEDHYSMCPVSDDNDPIEPVATYTRLVPPPAAPGLREALDLAIDAFDPMAPDWPDFGKSIAGLEALKSVRAALAETPGEPE